MNEENVNALLVELECPVCTNHMQPPIRQCKGGHSICTECCSKLIKCPTCNVDLIDDSRNFALEKLAAKLIRIPCHNSARGCVFSAFDAASISRHEIVCHFDKLQCPLAKEEECEWRGIVDDVLNHCVKTHGKRTSSVTLFRITVFNFNDPVYNTTNESYIIYADDQLFKYVCNINPTTGFFGLCIWHLSSNANKSARIENYRFKITFFEKEDYTGQTMTLCGPCPLVPFDKIPEKEHEKYFVGSNLAYLKNFCKSSVMYTKVDLIKPDEKE